MPDYTEKDYDEARRRALHPTAEEAKEDAEKRIEYRKTRDYQEESTEIEIETRVVISTSFFNDDDSMWVETGLFLDLFRRGQEGTLSRFQIIDGKIVIETKYNPRFPK